MIFIKGLGLLILIAAIFFAPMFGLYYLARFIFRFFERNGKEKNANLKYAELILSSKFVYYQKLNDKEKTKFLRRLVNFIDSKDFQGCGGLQLTEEMIVLISASSIQLTFGLEEFLLDHFSKIFVYPNVYFSKINKQYHKGETNLGGAIVLSWNHFLEGYNKPNDKVNLGLHEMAHALRFDKFKNDDYDYFFNTYFDKWQAIAKDEFKKTKEDSSSFFREYGGSNANEFFAVCIESFFESPAEFKKLHPEIYKHMCILLNQDPLANAYITNENTPRISLTQSQPVSGNQLYASSANGKNIMSLLFATAFWLWFTISNLKDGFSADIILFSLVMLIVGYFIVIRAFSKIHFFDNGIIIRSFIPDILDKKKEFRYDEIISIEFINERSNEASDTIKLIYLSNGKIRTRNFSDNFVSNAVLRIADILQSKKVAVKRKPLY